MPHLSFTKKEVDIRQYPLLASLNPHNGTQVTIGDLHGNALKLLYFLIEQRVVKLPEEDFKAFAKIYLIGENVYNLKPEHLTNYLEIVSKMIVVPTIKIRLMGDILCDRGSNDYFTLKILEKILQHNATVEIILSNHDSDFIEICEKSQTFDCFRLQPIHAMSMQDLQILINQGFVDPKEMFSIYERYYKPCLKPISYDINETDNAITLYSHAAIDISIIKAMAQILNVNFKDTTLLELAETIDSINQVFSTDYKQKNKIHLLLDGTEMWKGYENDDIKGEKFPFVFAIWNRNYRELKRSEFYNGYNVNYCHGHDLGEITRSNIFNLDNMLGKIRGSYYTGVYNLLYSS